MGKPKNRDVWKPNGDGGEVLWRNGRRTALERYPSAVDNTEELVKVLTAVYGCDEYVVRRNPNGQWEWWPHHMSMPADGQDAS